MSRCIDSTPRADGFRMPAEWEPHAQTWLLWPQRPDAWRLGAKPAQHAFVAIADAISRFEPVSIGVNHDQFENACTMVPGHIRVVEVSNNDAWMRDNGPVFVVNDAGDVRLVDWEFNAWGGIKAASYFPWDKDNMIPRKIAEMERLPTYHAEMILEGGAIHVDGQGTLITTEECLLRDDRNPDLSREQVETYLCDYLGVETIVWLGRGVDPHVTGGHVDEVACFVRPGVVLAASVDDESDWRYELLEENIARLRAATDARGRKLEVHRLPLPAELQVTAEIAWGLDRVSSATWRDTGRREPASYVNYYLCNGGVVMPSFGDPRDEEAFRIVQRLHHDRTVVAVPANEIHLNGGGIHCITKQQPAAGMPTHAGRVDAADRSRD
jgi:agmatine deiminase